MSSQKCEQCGLVNWATAETCQRCGAILGGTGEVERPGEGEHRITITRRVLVVVGLVSAFLFISYISLHVTSDPITFEQKKIVERTIKVLEENGFERNVFILRHLVSYRATDNWWNQWVGHSDAYAATNFPFEVSRYTRSSSAFRLTMWKEP